ncbi:glutamine amidotransferase subunit PdxT [Halalkalicoccus paucihalophilus]|uniref:Pyridoxal 5'-phosphate synthase subunit PdxT n=1 Tax=Halalkalicoccus paucihalophilus TaxID=1008153 RepID=A0A151AIV7_9EURY|nr:pyridoxal 5'-phosphate synthase glutaminase subunit PdxT [Halalkalicoccus paucihalophilus]KYH27563.1 glutamine amidotransferase subunit PdxT [Halalkalicoccus paucihalophilus]
MTLLAGVLAVQGNVSEHVRAISRAGEAVDERVEVREIRSSSRLPDCDLLLAPGGESTTISRLIHKEGIAPEIRDHVEAGKPVLATCAGLIVLGRCEDDRVESLGLLDVEVERNAFGRQRDSFETTLDVTGLDEPFPAVFIRAPVIADSRSCEVLASVEGRPVAVRGGPIVGTAFHPELTDDPRIHRLALFDSVAATQ